MNFQKFIYDFLKFNDISRRENDIFTDFEAQKSGEMGVKCRQNLRSSIKQPLGLRAEAQKSGGNGFSLNFSGGLLRVGDFKRCCDDVRGRVVVDC